MNKIFLTFLVLTIPFFNYGQSPKDLLIEFNQFIQNLRSIEYDHIGFYTVMNYNDSATCTFDFTNQDEEYASLFFVLGASNLTRLNMVLLDDNVHIELPVPVFTRFP